MKKYYQTLSKCALFNGIEKEDLLKMLTCFDAKVETFEKKYTIIAQGNRAKYIGIMLSGSAQIVRNDYYGNRSIISEIQPGEVFSEAFACAEVSSIPITVIANEHCEVMLIDSQRIMHTCTKHCIYHNQLIYNLMKEMAAKMLISHQKIEIVSKRTTRDKLMTYLMLMTRKEGSNSIEIPFNRQELADYLEVDRSGLSAEISKLRREGIIKCSKNRFELLIRN